MGIQQLNLPEPLRYQSIDWSPIQRLGEAFARHQDKQAIQSALEQATDASGNIDPAKAGTSLAKLGYVDEARPWIALAESRSSRGEASGLREREFAFRQSEAERAQRNADRAYELQAQQPVTIPFGAGLMRRSGEVIREPGLGETGQFDAATLDQLARQAIAGDTSVFTNLGRGAQGAANVIALRKRIAEINAGAGESGAEQAGRQAEYFGQKAGQRTLGTKQANIEMAAQEFNQILPVVQDASKAVSRTQYPRLNTIVQAYETNTGDPSIVAFGGGINTLINVYSRAISPSGVPTVSDKQHAREILDKAWSQGQFDAAVGMMQREINASLGSPEKVREEMRKRFLGGAGGTPLNELGKRPQEPPSAAPPRPTVTTQEQFDLLPSGRNITFIGPDGNVYHKP